MTTQIRDDALAIRKLIREAEAVSDEVMHACARLKQAIIQARQNPDLNVDAGQKALMRLTQAEAHALSVSTSLLRTHDELSKVARETMGGDGHGVTQVSAEAIEQHEMPALLPA